MGGVDYTGGCVVSRIDGGFSNGGYTLRLPAAPTTSTASRRWRSRGPARTCARPNETDIQREEHQQALFNVMKSRLLSPSSFLRLPWIAWNAPPAIISDMSGPTLLGLFGALAIGGAPPTKVLSRPGASRSPTAGRASGSPKPQRRAAVEQFMHG